MDGTAAPQRSQGAIKFFNTEKGFGFCERKGESDVFIHINELRRSGIDIIPQKGDKFEFDVVTVAGKAPKAANIRRLDA